MCRCCRTPVAKSLYFPIGQFALVVSEPLVDWLIFKSNLVNFVPGYACVEPKQSWILNDQFVDWRGIDVCTYFMSSAEKWYPCLQKWLDFPLMSLHMLCVPVIMKCETARHKCLLIWSMHKQYYTTKICKLVTTICSKLCIPQIWQSLLINSLYWSTVGNHENRTIFCTWKVAIYMQLKSHLPFTNAIKSKSHAIKFKLHAIKSKSHSIKSKLLLLELSSWLCCSHPLPIQVILLSAKAAYVLVGK